ncbi:MAG: hypothetical protein RQ867_05930 [Mariprofundaceae bacterium]|nr:hypothetical protein [Mariprofundaceae bacterium]
MKPPAHRFPTDGRPARHSGGAALAYPWKTHAQLYLLVTKRF